MFQSIKMTISEVAHFPGLLIDSGRLRNVFKLSGCQLIFLFS